MSLIKRYFAYLNDNPQKYWFKRKLYGWGWTPVTWQGWLVLLVYVCLILLLSLTVDEGASSNRIVFTFLVPLAVLTLALLLITYKKGEKPRWQWGLKK